MKLYLYPDQFTPIPRKLWDSHNFSITAWQYSTGVAVLRLANSKGYLDILPYEGQMIWNAEFENINLKLKEPFKEPRLANCILDTYGCFAFHSGILANGNPSPEDTHQPHGEFPCVPMEKAWLEISEQSIKLFSSYEYCQGFGHHYLATPSVELYNNSTMFKLNMKVRNLSGNPMPLQYMCHINYAYVPQGKITSNIPDNAFKLRQSLPAHIKPTEQWLSYTKELQKLESHGNTLTELADAQLYDPEIVLMAKALDTLTAKATFSLTSPSGYSFTTRFSTKEFPSVTRWIYHNPDMQVAAFALPATCTPEGHLAAQKQGTLVWLAPNQEKSFSVETGLNI